MQGTPLARGLIDAGEMVDGVNAAAVLVVISDGEDSCGQDPCATARRLKESKPQLKINVVDIAGDGAANCLAAITGGRVLQPEDGLSFEKMITRATEEALKPPHCP
jgi:Mg-chelatase subunit ChlD